MLLFENGNGDSIVCSKDIRFIDCYSISKSKVSRDSITLACRQVLIKKRPEEYFTAGG